MKKLFAILVLMLVALSAVPIALGDVIGDFRDVIIQPTNPTVPAPVKIILVPQVFIQSVYLGGIDGTFDRERSSVKLFRGRPLEEPLLIDEKVNIYLNEVFYNVTNCDTTANKPSRGSVIITEPGMGDRHIQLQPWQAPVGICFFEIGTPGRAGRAISHIYGYGGQFTPTKPGKYTVSYVVDDEVKMQKTFKVIDPNKLPDLYVRKMKLEDKGNLGKMLTVTIENIGKGIAEDFGLKVLKDNKGFNEVSGITLKPKEQKTLSFEIPKDKAGVEYKAIVDPENVVMESKEDNNEKKIIDFEELKKRLGH